MASNLGFRVGLLLDQFFSDRRRKCYFFVSTDKIKCISDLKETLVNKFSLPSNVQLLHNGFLLLDEDTVFVVRADEAIEVVPGTPIKKETSHKSKNKFSSLDQTSEEQYSQTDDRNTESLVHFTNGILLPTSDDINDSPGTVQTKKKKKRKRDSSRENDQSVNTTADVTSGIKFHSSPYTYISESARNSTGNETKQSPYGYACGSAETFTKNESKPHTSKQESSVPKKVNFQPPAEGIKEEEGAEIDKSLKRKAKNEYNRLKYSGVAELIKQMQSNGEAPTETVETVDAEIDDSMQPSKRKRVRRRRRKNKSNENNSTLMSTFNDTAPATNFTEQSKFQSSARIHKRFDSEEDLSTEFPGDVYNTEKYEAVQESNITSKLCNQISPLTPPSEHNSEDDLYKKLLDLKKLNKPAVFERAQVGVVDTIDDEDSGNSERIGGEGDSNLEPMESMDQSYCDQSAMQFEPALNVPRSSNNSDKDDTSSSTDNRRSDNTGTRKEPCPVHIQKNICDIDLEKIDINNYPVIESTRENDILAFKTLKLSTTSPSPCLSSPILARVLDVNVNDQIIFEILSGKEEFDFSKDDSLIEDNKSPNPLVSLKWTELYEPRLLYP